jgi:hypothetical protein
MELHSAFSLEMALSLRGFYHTGRRAFNLKYRRQPD